MRRALVFLVGMATACGGGNVALLVEETGDAGGDAASISDSGTGTDAAVDPASDSGADAGLMDSSIIIPDSGMQETADPPDTGTAETSAPIIDSGETTFNGCKLMYCVDVPGGTSPSCSSPYYVGRTVTCANAPGPLTWSSNKSSYDGSCAFAPNVQCAIGGGCQLVISAPGFGGTLLTGTCVP